MAKENSHIGMDVPPVCQRVAQVRTECAGPRGKAQFARMLDLAPSTYVYYETTRVPPADVLVRIADVADVDLRWLITGQPAGPAQQAENHPVLRQAADLMARRPQAAEPLGAFIELLSKSLQLPRSQPAAPDGEPACLSPHEVEMTNEAPASAPLPEDSEVDPVAAPLVGGSSSWIPVLGRTAAGVAQFWPDARAGAGLTTLNDLIARHAVGRPASIRQAHASGETSSGQVQMVLLTDPPGEICEFVAAPGLKGCYCDAFAVRIDGDSMAPDYLHGDLVVLSPSVPAADGRPAVVQLEGQIGVTCKLYRRQGSKVHLVAINDQYVPSVHAAGDVRWALRVLARVRG